MGEGSFFDGVCERGLWGSREFLVESSLRAVFRERPRALGRGGREEDGGVRLERLRVRRGCREGFCFGGQAGEVVVEREGAW